MKYQILMLVLTLSAAASGQKFNVEKSSVSFYSKAAIEDITAHTSKSVSLLDVGTDDIAFIIPIGEFEFAKNLMKEHFNEKYMDTEKFPHATFQGKLSGFDPKINTEQKATAKGKLTIHGVNRDVEIPGTMKQTGTRIELQTKFVVKLADYNISIPTLLFKNIAEQVEVTAEFTYKPQ